jgi:anti-sigma regulatory factor (Ser/Thr protein kinase)
MTGTVQSFSPCGDSLAALMAFVAERAATLNISRDSNLRLQLVAEELFTNTFRHGKGGAQGPSVTVCIEPDGKDLCLIYEDGEPAWNPLQQYAVEHLHLPLEQRPVGGLGALLVNAMAERSHYERVRERNRVLIWLRRDAGES